MAREYKLFINAQPGFYQGTRRKFHMYYAIPDAGIQKDTGILLLIAGYGGGAASHVYQKMRKLFADTYNMITLQCDYFGSRFMKGDEHLPVTEEILRHSLTEEEFQQMLEEPQRKMEILQGKTLEGYIDLKESPSLYNEMGILQAMDHLVALHKLQSLLKEGGAVCDTGNIWLYGQSHGGYLAYLCNALEPELFSGLIDNSAYLFPYYMDADREMYGESQVFSIRKLYHFLAGDIVDDRRVYDLSYWYDSFANRCRILSFHGKEDTMIPFGQKQAFMGKIPYTELVMVDEEMADGSIFSSCRHGLDADFIKLFACSYERLRAWEVPLGQGRWMERSFETEAFAYELSLQGDYPKLLRKGIPGEH